MKPAEQYEREGEKMFKGLVTLARNKRHYANYMPLWVAVAAVAWVSLQSDTVSGHWAYSGTDSHIYSVKDVENGPWYAVTMYSSGGTNEYRDGSVMVMDYHSNYIAVKNGKCGLQYPFCWGALNTPRARYYHSGNSYTLTQWSNMEPVSECLGDVDDHYWCWESSAELGWLTIPVTADVYRNVPLSFDDYPEYQYGVPPSFWCCSSVTPHTNEYEVD